MKKMNSKLFEAQKTESYNDLQSFIDEDEAAKKAFVELYKPDKEELENANGRYGYDEEIITEILKHMLKERNGFFDVTYNETGDVFDISITYDDKITDYFFEGLCELTKLNAEDLKNILKEGMTQSKEEAK